MSDLVAVGLDSWYKHGRLRQWILSITTKSMGGWCVGYFVKEGPARCSNQNLAQGTAALLVGGGTEQSQESSSVVEAPVDGRMNRLSAQLGDSKSLHCMVCYCILEGER